MGRVTSRKEQEHPPQIEKIADEERSRLPIEKGDTTRRVSRGMKDFQHALAEIDAIAMLEPPGRRASGNAVAGIEIAWQPAGIGRLGRECRRKAVWRIPRAKLLGFRRMDQDLFETKTCTDVVPIRVRLQDAGTPRRKGANKTGEIARAGPRIEHRDVAAALDQVALHVLAMMRLANHGDCVRKSPHLEPSLIRQGIRLRYQLPVPSVMIAGKDAHGLGA
jgi:hypothetical protein